jgi:hypothetical protein
LAREIAWTFKTMLKQINRSTEEKLGSNNRITIYKTNTSMEKFIKISKKPHEIAKTSTK